LHYYDNILFADLFLSVAITVDEIKELFEETENQMYTQNATLSTFEFGVYMLQVDAYNSLYLVTIDNLSSSHSDSIHVT
jgi:hypothetical protein